ncbi:MAG: hypothetical protein ACI3YT_07185, partial [Prevotella sp.]
NPMEYDNISEIFNYEMFDRQMNTFLTMWRVMIDGWDDYGPQELTFDILSLSAKASRLCLMADEDMARQLRDLKNSRKVSNIKYAAILAKMMNEDIVPMMKKAIETVRSTHRLESHRWPVMSAGMTKLLPMFDNVNEDKPMFSEISVAVAQVEELLKRNITPTKFAGMVPEEKMWNLMQVFVKTSYLLFHFQRLEDHCGIHLTDEEAGRILEATLQRYADSPEGNEELNTYFATLKYDNDCTELSIDQLREARRQLRNNVPKPLRLIFLNHCNNLNTMAQELIARGDTDSEEDFNALISAETKWQIIEQTIYSIEHPETIVTPIQNAVFRKALNGRPIDMLRLKECIRKMAQNITRKNHWFALWCVLRHHNLIADESLEHFAQQMMSHEWFGDVPADKRITGDTLREYVGYFTLIDYAAWDHTAYLQYRSNYHKTKWGDKLCNTMLRKCIEMEQLYDRGLTKTDSI